MHLVNPPMRWTARTAGGSASLSPPFGSSPFRSSNNAHRKTGQNRALSFDRSPASEVHSFVVLFLSWPAWNEREVRPGVKDLSRFSVNDPQQILGARDAVIAVSAQFALVAVHEMLQRISPRLRSGQFRL